MKNKVKDCVVQHIQRRYSLLNKDVVVPLDTRGNLKSYIEAYMIDHVIVGVYNDNKDIVDTYRLSYTDMSLKELKTILDSCLLFRNMEQFEKY